MFTTFHSPISRWISASGTWLEAAGYAARRTHAAPSSHCLCLSNSIVTAEPKGVAPMTLVLRRGRAVRSTRGHVKGVRRAKHTYDASEAGPVLCDVLPSIGPV